MKLAKRKKKSVDINDLVHSFVSETTGPLLDEGVWKCYGFRKNPLRKSLFSLLQKNSDLKNYIIKEIITMCLIDIINGIKKSRTSRINKLSISLGVIDRLIMTNEHLGKLDNLLESLLYTYENYLTIDKKNLHSLIVYRAKYELKKKDFSKFMEGTRRVLELQENGDFLIESSRIKKAVELSIRRSNFKISMSNDEYEKCHLIVKEKMLHL